MDRVGAAREPVVRELFRNLVTAQATRAVADRDELLSAFPDREAAEDVLHTLVDARLLTSYELEKERGASSRCRIEIVHESLLKAWPRLVRWRTQDEEGALLRDQLRQAARLWVDKGRTADLLWTGTAFQEFELWRSRYPGALTAVEEEFGRAMRDRALRSRRMRKTAVVAALVILSAVVVAVGISRQQAVAAARRAEASKLLAMAQERLAQDPTEALVFLTASVELTDTTEARRLALRALWEAPPALELGVGKPVWTPRFSLDGKQIATGGYMSGDARVFAEDGGTPRALKGHWGNPLWVSDRLVLDEDAGGSGKDHRATVWSLPDLKMERTFDFEGTSSFTSTGSRLMVSTEVGGSNGQPPERLLRSWAPGDTGLTELGRVPAGGVRAWFPDGTGLAHARGSTLVVRSFPFSSGKSEIVFGEHPPNIARIAPVGPGVNKLVTVNAENEMRLWTFENGTRAVFEDLAAPTGVQNLMGGRWLFRKAEQGMQLWPKGWWTAARPLFLRRNASWWSMRSSISPGGDWFVATTESYSRLTFWPLRRSYPIVVDGFRNENKLMAFSPDGRWLATAWPNVSVQLWPLVPGSGSPRTLDVPGLKGAAAGTHEANGLAFDPGGRFLFCVGNTDVWVVPLDGRPPVKLEGFKKVPYMVAAAVSPSGRQVATAYMAGEGDRTIRVWDLETKSTRAFDIPLPAATASSPAAQPGISSLAFGDEATLYSSDFGGVRRWDLATGRSEVVIDVKREGAPVSMVIRPAHGVAVTGKGGVLTLHDLSRGTARELPEFGGAVVSASLDSAGRMLVTGDEEGIIRVGRLSGGEPHLLIGHKGAAETAMSPDGKWIASAGGDNTLRLWPVPELDKPPLHALPHDALVAKLKSLTNLRAVRDEKASSGWRIDLAPFPGWKNAPEW
jgi:WD40 repeat protein